MREGSNPLDRKNALPVQVPAVFQTAADNPFASIDSCVNRPLSFTRTTYAPSGLCFASFTMCATINLAMSALIFTGSLWAVRPEMIAIAGKPGDQCAVCKSCNGFICKVLL